VLLLPENPDKRYQLVHDYLAAFIRQQQEPRLNELIAELKKEREQRQLTQEELKRAEQARQILAEANQKAIQRIRVGSAVLVAAVAALIWAGNEVGNALAQRKQADSRAKVAKGEVSKAQVELTKTKGDAQQANQDLKAARDNLAAANQQVQQVKQTVAQAEKAKQEAEARTQQANQNLKGVQDNLIAANQQAQQAKQAVAQAEKTKQEAETRTQQANQNLKVAQHNLTAANQQVQQTKQEVANAKTELARIDQQAKEQLQAATQKVKSAQEQAEQAQKAADEAKQTEQRLQEEAEKTRQELAQRATELETLNAQLNLLNRVQEDVAASIQDTLSKIEQQTGQKPAVIYVTIGQKDDDQLGLWLVTAKNQQRQQVPGVTRKQVLQVSSEFRQTVTIVYRPTAYLAPAQQLYEWMIKPLEEALQKQGINNLVFLMDLPLRSLPLAALHDGKSFLVEKYSIGLMPGLTLTDNRHVDIKNASVLAMGASKFTDQNPLPAVPVELSIIMNLWRGKSFLNEEFTFGNLKLQRQKQPFQIIHLATHQEFKPGSPENSYIQLWDNKLRLDQLERLGWYDFPVELLVLSASRSGLGDQQNKYGFAGSAVQAGVKSVLASFWHISDQGTMGLMAEFYTQLRTAPIKAEALRQAQVAMIRGQVRIEGGQLRTSTMSIQLPPELAQLKDQNFSHPYYWAGFTMIGNPW
jgi:CHAT domain-containing protein